jgi:hypothetical protein
MLTEDIRGRSDSELAKWVADLVARDVEEGLHLDHKSRFDRSPCELMKDLVAFSNERGGTIVVGVPEDPDKSGHPAKGPFGIQSDLQAVERLRGAAADAIHPRLPDWDIREVAIADKRVVYIVWVPRSWAGLHQTAERFYYRAGDRSLPMPEYLVRERYHESFQRRIRAGSWLESPDIAHCEERIVPNSNFRAAILPTFDWTATVDDLPKDLTDLSNQLSRAIQGQELQHTWFGFHTLPYRGDDRELYLRIYATGHAVLWDALLVRFDHESDDKVTFLVHGMLQAIARLLWAYRLVQGKPGVAGAPAMLDIAWRVSPDHKPLWKWGHFPDEVRPAVLEAGSRVHIAVDCNERDLPNPKDLFQGISGRLHRYVGIPRRPGSRDRGRRRPRPSPPKGAAAGAVLAAIVSRPGP